MTRKGEQARPRGGSTEVTGLVLLALALVAACSLLSYDAGDRSWFHSPPDASRTRNWFGWVGATMAETVMQSLGATSFLAPLALAGLGWRRILGRPAPRRTRMFGQFMLVLALCALLDLLYGSITFGGERSFPAGGWIGARSASFLRALFNTPGALLVSALTLAAVVVLSTRFSFVRSVEWIGRHIRDLGTSLYRRAPALHGALSRRWTAFLETRARPIDRADAADAAVDDSIQPPPSEQRTLASAAPVSAAATPTRSRPKLVLPSAPESVVPDGDTAHARQVALPLEPGARGCPLPPVDLLNEPAAQTIESEAELLERARQITDKFREFSVNGSVVAIHPGPVVTTFEFKPEAGVKYSKITSMTEDLSLALKAESVRIDRMAGRATVGIEVPNRRQETIYPRELFDSEKFRNSASKLTLALGKAINGDVFTADLDRMPHLLIAGATGAGKSVGLNGMIASILYKATPEEVRFIMIDTKMIELGIYADIPHLLIPVVTEPKQASTALKWAVAEMEQRYRKLATVGVRNLTQFNAKLADEPGRTMDDVRTGEAVPLTALPYIVIVIDELADLMMVSSADVEESIMRLAQMARAVGIHLIIATQRPSVDVITGTIKANFPSRIAFRVSQRVDSRTIIDQQGAEHLLGRGDMLFLPTGSSRLMRLHGGLITESELHRITTYLKRMAEPVYDESVLRDADEETGPLEGERDEMYGRAVRVVLQEGKCSITLIQRRLQLGYARAARIVDVMERDGVVSPGEGSKPRDVLVGPEFLAQLEAPR